MILPGATATISMRPTMDQISASVIMAITVHSVKRPDGRRRRLLHLERRGQELELADVARDVELVGFVAHHAACWLNSAA